MGLCASADATEEQQHGASSPVKQQKQADAKAAAAAPAAEQQPTAVQPTSARSSTTKASSGSDSAPMGDAEYRSQIKSIFLFICDRLLQTMEYERDSMHQLAALKTNSASVEQQSYLPLFASTRVEQFIRSVFDVSHVPAPAASADRTVAEQNFILLVKSAQQVSDSGPALGRVELTQQAKAVCSETQRDLEASSALLTQHKDAFGPRYTDLQAHFQFFIRTLNFTQGDIANDAQLLERNVEAIINSSS